MSFRASISILFCALVAGPAYGQSQPSFEDVLKKVERGESRGSSYLPSGATSPTPAATPQRKQRATQVFTGIYEIEVVAPEGRPRARMLLLGSGEQVVLGYGLSPEEFVYIDRSVVVRGKKFQSLPGEYPLTQGHIEVSQIGLAPGEEPNPRANQSLPIPEAVSDLNALVARAGKWASVSGILMTVTSDTRTLAHRAKIKLDDGTMVQVDYLTQKEAALWVKRLGTRVKVIGRARVAQPMRLDKPAALCPSTHPVCSHF